MKKINKQAVETFKTVLIAILVTAVVAFVAGMRYADNQNAKLEAAVKNVQAAVVTESKEPKKQ